MRTDPSHSSRHGPWSRFVKEPNGDVRTLEARAGGGAAGISWNARNGKRGFLSWSLHQLFRRSRYPHWPDRWPRRKFPCSSPQIHARFSTPPVHPDDHTGPVTGPGALPSPAPAARLPTSNAPKNTHPPFSWLGAQGTEDSQPGKTRLEHARSGGAPSQRPGSMGVNPVTARALGSLLSAPRGRICGRPRLRLPSLNVVRPPASTHAVKLLGPLPSSQGWNAG